MRGHSDCGTYMRLVALHFWPLVGIHQGKSAKTMRAAPVFKSAANALDRNAVCVCGGVYEVEVLASSLPYDAGIRAVAERSISEEEGYYSKKITYLLMFAATERQR
jgi:hypothetical protein